jgi:serine phosphatase RsbU (regulator of sigma subunit)
VIKLPLRLPLDLLAPGMAGAAPVPTADCDREMESERTEWLRRRFMAFCALWAFVSFCFVFPILLSFTGPAVTPGTLALWDLACTLPGLLIPLGALWYAWRKPVARETLFAMTYWLTVIGFVVTAAWGRGLVILDNDPTTTFRSSARGLPLAVLARHVLPCLLIPWTLRESIRPAIVLVVLVACVMTVDAFRRDVPLGMAIAYTLGSAAAVAPGAVLCWLRHSQYRRDFTLRFESELYRRLQSELSGARQVHESCLPPAVTDGPVRLSYAYEPMRQIGGDLLFVYPPPTVRACGINGGPIVGPGAQPLKGDGPVSAVILDVTGHGIAAALMVNRMVGELERLFAENPYARPGDVLAALNRYVHLTLARNGLFATALCLRANPTRGMIEWASGGNPPAYLRRPDGRIRTLAPTAAMLGILDPNEYDPAPDQLPFAVGDVVCAYTDGAFEATDAKGSPIGTAGVSRLLSGAAADGLEPDQYAAAMLAKIAAHRGGLPDDDTLIVIMSHVNAEASPERAAQSADAGRKTAAVADAAAVPAMPQNPSLLIPLAKGEGAGRGRYSVGPTPPGGAGDGPGEGPGPGDGPGEGLTPGGVGPGRGAPPPGTTGDKPGAGTGEPDAGD